MEPGAFSKIADNTPIAAALLFMVWLFLAFVRDLAAKHGEQMRTMVEQHRAEMRAQAERYESELRQMAEDATKVLDRNAAVQSQLLNELLRRSARRNNDNAS